MTDSLDQLDDLEIYLLSNELEQIKHWLTQRLPAVEFIGNSKRGFRFKFNYQQQVNQGQVHCNAGNTGFTSVWLRNKASPWENDVAMARDAFAFLQVTTRCIESAWSKGDDPDQWLEISEQGEHLIQWVTEE